ncbi:MAG: hypothetical protein OTJ97_02035 [SAR202 cluster bacterium]|nr:hypothetical protein [SAR202 cluster bacterium]
MASLIGPRPLLVESGIRDTGFPIEASREPAAAVRRYYQVAGVPERFDVDEFDARPPVERTQGLRLASEVAVGAGL